MTQTVLELKAVSLILPATGGPVTILREVDFGVRAGEAVAVAGPSGSGKSSLLAVSAGLERATAGSVMLLGEEITGRSEAELARLRRGRIGFVFQSFHLMPAMTALENVLTALEIAGVPGAKRRARAALDEVGLSHRFDHYPGQLSGGECQRVAVARALSVEPEIVFADEPTGNLDAASGAGVADLLFDSVPRRGAALILVTHDHGLARRADRIAAMDDGRLCDGGAVN